MTRKWLFGALTLVLLAVLVTLIIQGNKLEKQKANQPVEIIQKSKPTPTRALRPKDIEILRSKMNIEPDVAGTEKTQNARHELEIRNTGNVAYDNIELSFDYLDGGNKVLDNRTYSVNQAISPDSSLNILDIEIDSIPGSTVDFSVTVLFADIRQAPAPDG